MEKGRMISSVRVLLVVSSPTNVRERRINGGDGTYSVNRLKLRIALALG